MTREITHSPLDFRAMPPVLRLLLIANGVGFLLAWLVGRQFYDLFGLVPRHLWYDRWVWQPVTYLFIHGDVVHLLFNLLALWMFGVAVEAQWGPRGFLKYYLLTGVGGGLFTALAAFADPRLMHVPVLGASGAIFGLLVAFAMLYPEAVVYLYFFFPMKARHMALLFGLLEFFAGATSSTPGVARFAHLGGMVIGYLYIRWSWIVQLRLKTLWRGAAAGAAPRPAGRRPSAVAARMERIAPAPKPDPEDEVDRILDKISAFGKDSLSPEERDILRRASERRRGPGGGP